MTQLKYLQIRDRLVQRIDSAVKGDKLPSERNLAKEYGCSFLTIRKALDILEEQGCVTRRVGSGTFVGAPLPAESSNPRPPQRSNSTGPITHIGVLLHQGGDAYAMQLAATLESFAQSHELTLIIKMIGSLSDSIQEKIEQCREAGARAMVLPWFPGDQVEQVRNVVANSPLPVCLPDCISGLERYCFESPDIYGVSAVNRMYTAGKYFYDMQYRNIALLLPPAKHHSIVQKNLAGYVSFCAEYGLQATPFMTAGAEDIEAMLSQLKPCMPKLAIVTFDDSLAIQCIMAGHKLGLSAGKDFVILGCNDTPEARLASPALSTMPQRFDYASRCLLTHACALAKGQSEQSNTPPTMQISVRESCGGKAYYGAKLDAVLAELNDFTDGLGH